MKLYGIDYNSYMCAGLGNKYRHLIKQCTLIFQNEIEMLKKVTELKQDATKGEVRPFITYITEKEKYEI